jgi:hypothetical protein
MQGSSTEGTRSWVYHVPNLDPRISIGYFLHKTLSLQSISIGEVIPRQLTPFVGSAGTGFYHPGRNLHHLCQQPDRIIQSTTSTLPTHAPVKDRLEKSLVAAAGLRSMDMNPTTGSLKEKISFLVHTHARFHVILERRFHLIL